jgi:hypothetical protein
VSIEPKNDERPTLNFDRPEPSTVQRLCAGHQYEYAPGMAPKPRDPAVDAAIEAYLAKYRNRPPLKAPALATTNPTACQLEQLDDVLPEFLMHEFRPDANGRMVWRVALPKRLNAAALAAKFESFSWKDGTTKIPMGFCTTEYGKRAVAAYKGQASWDYTYYRRSQPSGASEGTSGSGGSGAYNATQSVRNTVYSDGSNLSLLGGFSTLLPMPADRYCAYTKCTNGSFAGRPCRAALDPDRHIDVKYCDKDCAQKHRRLLAKDKTRVANEPLKPKIFCAVEEPANDVIDVVDVSSPVKPDVISENTYREGFRNFRDDPIGQLFAHGEITQAQYDATVDYVADLDEVGARLRAPHRDELDISVWIPRAPDSNAPTGREIRASRNPTALARIRAANQAMGREATALLHAALASNTIDDVEMLRAALDALITSRKPQWTKPREKSSIRSTSPSPALQESEF